MKKVTYRGEEIGDARQIIYELKEAILFINTEIFCTMGKGLYPIFDRALKTAEKLKDFDPTKPVAQSTERTSGSDEDS